MPDKKILTEFLSETEKQYGKGAVVRLGQKGAFAPVSVISSGVLSVDHASGIGGFPRGRIIEIYGGESGGKTTLCLQCIAQAQAAGGDAAFVDAEHALDPKYAKKLGVNTDYLYVSQPDSGEQALEICETMVKSAKFDIIVVDSVAALVPQKELEGEMGDAQMGLHARLMSQAMRKLCATVSKSNTLLIFINQVREKIGVVYGNPEVTTGGRALKFYASMRVVVNKGSAIKEGNPEKIVGTDATIKFVKNKLAAPFQEAEVNMLYGRGFCPQLDALKLGEKMGFVEKSGSFFSYKGERLGQGKTQAVNFLTENTEIFGKLWNEVRDKLQTGV